jgi:hypothetical protein
MVYCVKVRIYGIIIRKRTIAAVKICIFFVCSDKKFLFIKKQWGKNYNLIFECDMEKCSKSSSRDQAAAAERIFSDLIKFHIVRAY